MRPMLASTGQDLPRGDDWGYEFKWDGVRAVAVLSGGTLRLWARSGAEITAAYPELKPLAGQLTDAVLDGEMVALDADGKPSFTLLAERMHVREPSRAAKLAATIPVTYMIFDVLSVGGADVTNQPYAVRRQLLESLNLGARHWLVPPMFTDGPATRAAAKEYALEGVVAKRLGSTYQPGQRSPDWVKVKEDVTDEFVVGGWRPGARRIGGLLVGVPDPALGGGLRFCGRVGGGISAAAERALLAVLEPLRTTASPFHETIPREDARAAIWVRPETVVEIRYGNRTPDGRLRFPRFLRLRPDRTPQDWEE